MILEKPDSLHHSFPSKQCFNENICSPSSFSELRVMVIGMNFIVVPLSPHLGGALAIPNAQDGGRLISLNVSKN